MNALELPPQVSLHATCPVGWALVRYDKSEGCVEVRGKIAGLEFGSKDKLSSLMPAAVSLIPVVQKVLARFESTEESGEGIDVHLSGIIDGEEIRTQTIRIPLRVAPMQQLTAFNSVLNAMRKKMSR